MNFVPEFVGFRHNSSGKGWNPRSQKASTTREWF
jgi:hypothetical protein